MTSNWGWGGEGLQVILEGLRGAEEIGLEGDVGEEVGGDGSLSSLMVT